MKNIWTLAACAIFILGCGAGREFPAIPAGAALDQAPRDTIDMAAERYRFIPEEVRVKAGTLVIIRIKATDATHGFALPAYGIDERIEKDSVRTVQFYAGEKGEYDFHCSHFCGIGHFGMTGTVIVE